MSQVLTNAAEFTVSELAGAVKRTIEDAFDYVRVRGEISGFRGVHASGHSYFTLKDENASIDAVIWKTSWPRLLFKPAEGLEVIATGRLTTFPKSSKYQIVIEQLQPAGAGALMALLEERRKKLAAEGLFAKERKRPLPYLPRVIGVVTSPTGAVIRDILHRLDDRFPSHVIVWPVRVQGDTCAAEVAAAIRGFSALAPGGAIPRPDLLIVARGGGSIEDLWGFNEEAVVRAVVASTIPVISAVGHETDMTLIDYAADLRAPTPTAAAEAAVPVRAELIGYVDDLGQRTRNCVRRAATNARDRFRAASVGLPRPDRLLGDPRQALDKASAALSTSLRHLGQQKRIELGRTAPRLALHLLTRRVDDLGQRLVDLCRRSESGVVRMAERKRAAFDATAARLSPKALAADLRHARIRLQPCAERLTPAFARVVAQRMDRLDTLDKLLESYSYRSVLDRGFALVTDSTGTVVRSTTQATPGRALSIEVADGTVGATVSGAPAIPRRRRRVIVDDRQESLF